MRRMCTAVGLLSVLVLPAVVNAAERLEDRFGKEYVLLASVNDAAAFRAALERTGLWATWREGELQRFLEPALKKAEQAIAKAVGVPAEELFAALPGQVVFGLLPAPPGDPERGGPRLVFLVQLGAARANAERVLQHVRKQAGGREIARENLPDGTTYEALTEDVLVAIKGDLLALANGKDTLAGVLRGPLPVEARLVETERFKAAMKPFGPRRPEGMTLYFDLAATLARIEAEGDLDEEARAALEHLGLYQIQAIGSAVRPAGKQILTQTHVYAPGWTKGVLKPFGRDARALLRAVPPDAVSAAAVRFDPSKVYDLIAGSFAAADEDDFQEAVTKLNEELGFDLARDLIDALGTDAVWYALPEEGGQGAILQRSVFSVSLRHRDRLARALDQLGKRLGKELDKGGPVQYRREEADGAIWHLVEVKIPLPQVPGLEVAIALGEKRLVVGTRRADVAAALARGGKPLEKSFLDRPGVAAALDRVGGDGAVVAHIDPRPHAHAMYRAAVITAVPALSRARGAARQMECAARLRQVGLAVFQYEHQHRKMPASVDDVKEYLVGVDVRRCPTTGKPYHLINYSDTGLTQMPPDSILAYEVAPAHNGLRNVLFADGRVESMRGDGFKKSLEKVPAHLRAKEPKPEPGQAAPVPLPEPTPRIPGMGPLPSAEALFKHLTDDADHGAHVGGRAPSGPGEGPRDGQTGRVRQQPPADRHRCDQLRDAARRQNARVAGGTQQGRIPG